MIHPVVEKKFLVSIYANNYTIFTLNSEALSSNKIRKRILIQNGRVNFKANCVQPTSQVAAKYTL